MNYQLYTSIIVQCTIYHVQKFHIMLSNGNVDLF